MGLILRAFYPVALINTYIFVPIPYCFDTLALWYSLKSGSLIPTILFFFLKIPFMCVCGGGYLFIYFCACVYKNLSANAGDLSLIPGLRRSPGEGNGSQLQRFCLGNSIERGVLWATVPGVTKS